MALTFGCTQDFGVFEPDSAPSDATASDAADAGADVATDSAPTDSAVDAPVEAGSLTFACGNQTVADCTQCNGFPEPCVYCQQGKPSVLAGRCTTTNGSCFQGAPNGFALCTCNDASTCPEGYEVCRNQTCRTCSDSNSNNGLTCKSGGTCNNLDGGCI